MNRAHRKAIKQLDWYRMTVLALMTLVEVAIASADPAALRRFTVALGWNTVCGYNTCV